MRVGWVDDASPLRKAVLDKAGAYGRLEAPYVVAVNSMLWQDEIDAVDALFGEKGAPSVSRTATLSRGSAPVPPMARTSAVT